MPKLLIELSQKEHDQLKSQADLQGISIEEYMRFRTLSPQSEQDAMEQLKSCLVPRINEALRDEVSAKTFQQIRDNAQSSYKT